MNKRYIISLVLDFLMFIFFGYVWVSFYLQKGFDPVITILCLVLAILLLRDAYKLFGKILNNNKK
ncbi:MAG: hypothetical protein RR425_05465 [Erysipelotrichales bacterium]